VFELFEELFQLLLHRTVLVSVLLSASVIDRRKETVKLVLRGTSAWSEHPTVQHPVRAGMSSTTARAGVFERFTYGIARPAVDRPARRWSGTTAALEPGLAAPIVTGRSSFAARIASALGCRSIVCTRRMAGAGGDPGPLIDRRSPKWPQADGRAP
jgi:hypothetical protein